MKFAMLMPWATIMLLFSCGAGTINCTTLNGNDTDFISLLDFKRAIINDPKGALSSWNTTIHFCSWEGVVCSQTRPERVVKLNLSGQALEGHISPSLGNMSYLIYLYLPMNIFSGHIPPHLGYLRKLQFLNLGNNSLQGNIPDAVTNCSSLLGLYLQGNLLVGEIPKKLALLSNLLDLWLDSNNLSGAIPPDLGNITTLRQVSLQYNQLHGSIPEELGKLSNMSNLLLGINSLSDRIPETLLNLSSLQQLAMPVNMLHGPLPYNIGNFLPNLRILLLSGNMLGGRIPDSLANASELQYIELGDNYGFTGKIPPSLGKLRKLRMLYLSHNNLKAEDSQGWEFLDALTNCTLLEQLLLYGNQLQGVLPNSVGNLSSNLEYLMLGSNMLYASVPSSLENLHKVTLLDLSLNSFTGPIDGWIGNMVNLEGLFLHRNTFSGHIPDSIGNFSKLSQLFLTANQFHGPIPSSLGKLQQLSILDLGYNNLQGNIPKDLIAATVIQCSLSHNNLEGQIPYVGNLLQLSHLDLSSNKLTGEIPPSLGTCKQLQTVIMDSNFLSGSIPAFFGQLGSLTMLNLSYNNFSGSIPISLSKLQLLAQLDLSHNHLDGEVPTEGVFKNTTAVSLEGNWGLCGGVLDLHMPPCPNPTQKRIGWRHYFLRIVIPIIGIVSITLLIYFIISRKKVPRARLPPSFSGEQFPNVSYKDLAQATENFAESNLLGRGSHGSVYKGRLITPEPMVVAVKVFDLAMEGTDMSFISECQALRHIRHRNLVPILTACSTIDNMGNDFKGLVYRFMPNGSLDTWLHSPGHGNLDLSQRLKIIVDVAHALQYIHHDCETPIIHCDLKPSNILLDGDMVAHLADFGIARFYLETRSQTVGDSRSTGTINMKGTIGYIAPEYARGTYLSTCGDVYRFGVVLMEMLTGKRPTDPLFCNGLSIISFCKTSFPDQILDIVDTHLLEEHQECARGANPEDENRVLRCLVALVKVALSCTCEAPADRTNMREAAAELHRIKMAHW
ncbi:receptor kinase-like protein Xa21 [Miscanthus floridulus]|uniref:receptor kinase-like protein Xa21 n=1 Tax=Miscanthus floridulus TaxID=154761 RepID=UPI00345949F7